MIFTDHFFSVEFLEILGEDFRQLRKLEEDTRTVVHAFMLHAKQYFPEEFFIVINGESIEESAKKLLSSVNLKAHDLSNIIGNLYRSELDTRAGRAV
ncbi:MAG: hypothetical protein L3J71_08845 [Victivallaceae bacterium]|nr:hypothetical protein [Victivallaceae bacterium]